MLIWLIDYLSSYHTGFNAFHYLTLRAIFTTMTSLFICLLLGIPVINYLHKLKVGQAVRECGPKSHLQKNGTPTMGGVLIIISIVITTLLWSDLSSSYTWICLLVLCGFGGIGLVDDYKKVVYQNSDGIASRWKFFWQSLFAILVACWLFFSATSAVNTDLIVPFFKHVAINLGPAFIILAYLVIVGTSNAVNLTDGLDGLAILPAILVIGALAVFAYVSGHVEFAHYLAIPYLPGAGELVIISCATVGAGLGFLWFNTYPAQVFMGDVGSLALGALIGLIAVILRQEIVLFIMGGIFVAETVSVMLQVASFKLTGKRIFKMAPLHHHFELSGWEEPKVIVRFWLITLVLVLFGLATLKLR